MSQQPSKRRDENRANGVGSHPRGRRPSWLASPRQPDVPHEDCVKAPDATRLWPASRTVKGDAMPLPETTAAVSRCWRRLSSVLLLAVVGCGSSGPEIGRVAGVVTLDGRPLPEAFVYFRHEGGGRNSQAVTDADGRYELNYSASEAGAIVGPNTVRITTFVDPNYDDAGKLIKGTGVKELVPRKYNRDSELKVEVKPGRNELDFKLLSSG